MGEYKIRLVELPAEDDTSSSRPMEVVTGIKEAFWDNNLSLCCCIAMVLNMELASVKIRNPHILLYGRYLGGFLFEGFDKLPPLCILNAVSMGIPLNAVYCNGLVYDPKTGVFTSGEYEKKFVKVISYIQLFIEEAYTQTAWRPELPASLEAELYKHEELKAFFCRLSPLLQSKIINYVHPFSKPSSLKTLRACAKPYTAKQLGEILDHIRYLYNQQIN